jgi:Arc/MetJ-type ribon-helix-helix transcriptional regulator
MATKKVTVTLDEGQLDEIRLLVEAGQTSSISGFVQHAVAVSLDDVAGWRAMLGLALEQSGGPITDEEREWGAQVLAGSGHSNRSVA